MIRKKLFIELKIFNLFVLLSMLFMVGGCTKKNLESIDSIPKEFPDQVKAVQESIADEVFDIGMLSADKNRMMTMIEKLCITPRKIGTDEEKDAAKYLKEELESIGYKTQVQEFPFQFITKVGILGDPERFFDFTIDSSDGTSQNVIAIKESDISTKDIIILSAHYDTVSECVGAIDNASGVAALMEIARQLKDVPSKVNIQFIFFSAEENSLYGSRYYVSKLREDERKSIIANINLDMLGEKGDIEPILGTASGEENEVCKLFEGSGLEINRGLASDYVAFYKADIPALNIIQYSSKFLQNDIKKNDTFSRIDEDKLKEIVDIIIQQVAEYIMLE